MSAGVPTVWLGILQLLEKDGGDLGPLQRIICGGSAAPVSMIRAYEERHGVQFIHAYGMTEATPVTHFSRLKSTMADLPVEARYGYKAKQGLLVPGLEQRVVDADGHEVPADGKSMGELQLRGPTIASEYLDDPRSAQTFVDGWYHTGDVATVDHDGYLHVVDRTKDLVKSGGEWISSVELENALMGHPEVAQAAVIAIPDEKWGERPGRGRPQARRRGRRGRGGRLGGRQVPQVVAARAGRVRRRDPHDRHRQVLQAPAARALRGQRPGGGRL